MEDAPNPAEENEPDDGLKKYSKIGAAAIAGLLLLAVIFFVWMYQSNKSDEENSTQMRDNHYLVLAFARGYYLGDDDYKGLKGAFESANESGSFSSRGMNVVVLGDSCLSTVPSKLVPDSGHTTYVCYEGDTLAVVTLDDDHHVVCTRLDEDEVVAEGDFASPGVGLDVNYRKTLAGKSGVC